MRRFLAIFLVILFAALMLGVAFADPEGEPGNACDSSGESRYENPHCDGDGDGRTNEQDSCPRNHSGTNDTDADGCPDPETTAIGPGNPGDGGPGDGDSGNGSQAADCVEFNISVADQSVQDPTINDYLPPQSGDPAPLRLDADAEIGTPGGIPGGPVGVHVHQEVVDPPRWEANGDAAVAAGCQQYAGAQAQALRTVSEAIGTVNETRATVEAIVNEHKP